MITPPLASATAVTGSGNAYLYNIISNTWTGTDGLLSATGAPYSSGDANFGSSVALTSTHALIGARTYNYTPSGSATAVSDSGNAYLYNVISGAWTGTDGLLSTTGAPTAQASASFGTSVALSATHALIGAENYNYSSTTDTGNAYLYGIESEVWVNIINLVADAPKLQSGTWFGSSVALSDTHALIGARVF